MVAASIRAVLVHPQPVLLWDRAGGRVVRGFLSTAWAVCGVVPSTEGNTLLSWAVPVLNPLAWHQGSILALESSLGSILLLFWGLGIVCLPWHAMGRECQQAMGHAPWQVSPLS